MIRDEYNPDSGLSLYSAVCDGDDCEESLTPRSSEFFAIVDAAAAKWLVRKPKRKFSGVIHRDYCPKCRKKEENEHQEVVPRVRVFFGSSARSTSEKR